MREVFPNYYDKFKCVADKCRHSCCIGWEIDIDEDTLDFYNALDGAIAKKIHENIDGEPPHFVLKEGERCPFLNRKGLCDIILTLGEGALCDICRMHPRFCNFYEDFAEIGLGLSCEEAARIILTEEEKFSISLPKSVGNDAFFKERKVVFDILQDRSISVLERLQNLSQKYGFAFDFSNKALYEFYMHLEMLDETWKTELLKLKNAEGTDIFKREDMQIFFEQLACYFIFRHFESGVEFAILSTWVLGMICSNCKSLEQMLDAARMYSQEIEYSEENTEKVKMFLDKYYVKEI